MTQTRVTSSVEVVVADFNAAFNRHDVDGVMSLMTADCVFESTAPPDGRRYTGSSDVRACWEQLFGRSPTARFECEEVFFAGDRAVVRWSYRWDADDGPSHVRGVDLVRVRDNKVAEKLSYVKG